MVLVGGKTNTNGIPNPLQLAMTASAYFNASYVTAPPLPVQKVLVGVLRPIACLLGYRADYPYPYEKSLTDTVAVVHKAEYK